jgi:hypothetical protein
MRVIGGIFVKSHNGQTGWLVSPSSALGSAQCRDAAAVVATETLSLLAGLDGKQLCCGYSRSPTAHPRVLFALHSWLFLYFRIVFFLLLHPSELPMGKIALKDVFSF